MLNRNIARFCILSILLTSLAFAGVPNKLGKQAARKAASALINACNESPDAVECLEQRGCDCELLGANEEQMYRCTWTMSVEATEVRTHDAAPAERMWSYEITYEVKKKRSGWRGKTKSIRELKD